ncbi:MULTISPECIES: hypothetical protein [unclassified Streptomyces]|uniref:hypothetical protein n=1 Tax=unclassified Streptomyces TaxID=2593676 RepID=UPI0023653473|nr:MULTISPECIES: hypothetical protein [unclassified Streptomyces]MDF3143695.1 hypothetical protein [Streptomyces sp. T21Q-yed]WDF38139.1 hypothetical protein PBV52_15680 [Streptomyces sp. T12]
MDTDPVRTGSAQTKSAQKTGGEMRNHAAVSVRIVGIMTAVTIPFISLFVSGTPETGYSMVALQTDDEKGPSHGSDHVPTPQSNGPDGWVWD